MIGLIAKVDGTVVRQEPQVHFVFFVYPFRRYDNTEIVSQKVTNSQRALDDLVSVIVDISKWIITMNVVLTHKLLMRTIARHTPIGRKVVAIVAVAVFCTTTKHGLVAIAMLITHSLQTLFVRTFPLFDKARTTIGREA